MTDYEPLFTRLPTDREECWSKLEHFVEFWHKVSCAPVDVTREVLQCEARLQLTLPDAIVEWHTRFSRFINLGGNAGFTLPLDRLRIHHDILLVRTEPVFSGRIDAHWGIPLRDLESPDPPVVGLMLTRVHACATHLSHFAVISAAYDTVMLPHAEQQPVSDGPPYLSEGTKMEFPDSFGIIETEMYEGRNWLALASGKDIFFRQRDLQSGIDHFPKREGPYKK